MAVSLLARILLVLSTYIDLSIIKVNCVTPIGNFRRNLGHDFPLLYDEEKKSKGESSNEKNVLKKPN